jgi:transposase
VKSFLRKYNNNIKQVAEKLDIGVATIYRMLKEEKSEMMHEIPEQDIKTLRQ